MCITQAITPVQSVWWLARSRAPSKYLENSAGFEIGVGPSVVVVDTGKAKTLTTTTVRADVYVLIYGQKRLMAALGLQGSKITKTSSKPIHAGA